MHIVNLHDNYTGYINVTIPQRLECLCENYGDLDENDLEATEKALKQEFDILKPFSVFAKRVEDWMGIEEVARDPQIDAQIVNKVFSTLLKSDVLHDGERKWRIKSNTTKT